MLLLILDWQYAGWSVSNLTAYWHVIRMLIFGVHIIAPSKALFLQMKNTDIFLVSPQKQRLSVLIRSASQMRFEWVPQHMFSWRNKKKNMCVPPLIWNNAYSYKLYSVVYCLLLLVRTFCILVFVWFLFKKHANPCGSFCVLSQRKGEKRQNN